MRPLCLAVLVGLVACLAVPATAPAAVHGAARVARVCRNAAAQPAAETLPAVHGAVLCLLNRERATRGLPALRSSARLRRAATGHSVDMARRDYFEHTTPDGVTMTARIVRSGYLSASRSWSVGENIAWGSGTYATPSHIVDAWMHSPGHRANILKRRFREIGIGIALDAPRRGVRGGATYTTDFGVRR